MKISSSCTALSPVLARDIAFNKLVAIENRYYLQSLRIKPTYKSLCLYFPQHIGFTITQKQQCQGYTKKGNRCPRYCYGKLCYHHNNTLYMYKNSKMFHYLMKDVL